MVAKPLDTVVTMKNETAKLLDRIADCLRQDENVLFALIFGSYASGKQRPDSDLDLAVCYRNPPEGLDVLYAVNDLSNAIGKEVDLVVLNRASAFLRHQVMKTGVRIFIRDDIAFRDFRDKAIRDYMEYKYISGMDRYDDKRLIERKRRRLEKFLREIESADPPEDFKAFSANTIFKRFVERNIELAIEQMIDICRHMVAAMNLGEPESYAHCFELLTQAGVLPEAMLKTFQSMARYRNFLIHGYDGVDDAVTYGVYQRQLEDFRAFAAQIRRHIQELEK